MERKNMSRMFALATMFASILIASVCSAQAAPTVASITPSVGNVDSMAYITDLAGTNFQDGVAVKLKKSGESDVDGETVSLESSERIVCEFNLSGVDDGYWDVYVENPDGQSATLADGFQVTQGVTIASILFRKDGPASASVGDKVRYGLTVSNTGNVVLQNVTIDDDMLGTITVGSLAVTQTDTFYRYYTITEDDPNPLVNTATATGSDSAGTSVTDKNDHSIAIVPEVLDIKKAGPASAKSGETITYTFTVENTGNEDLNNGEVTDPLFGPDWSWDFGDLTSGETKTSTQTYTITDADTFPLTNTATVTAFDGAALEVTDEDSWTVASSGSSGSCSQLVPGTPPALGAMVFPGVALLLIGAARRRRGR